MKHARGFAELFGLKKEYTSVWKSKAYQGISKKAWLNGVSKLVKGNRIHGLEQLSATE